MSALVLKNGQILKLWRNATFAVTCLTYDLKIPTIRDDDYNMKYFYKIANSEGNLKHPLSFNIPIFVYNFNEYEEQYIVYEFKTRPNCKIY